MHAEYAVPNTSKRTLARFAGLSLGILLGLVVGPLIFRSLNPLAITEGSVLGGFLGFLSVTAILWIQEYRRDLELLQAAEAIRTEAGLPSTITIRITTGRAVLEGTVEDPYQRRAAEETIRTLSGLKEVVNRIRIRSCRVDRPAEKYLT